MFHYGTACSRLYPRCIGKVFPTCLPEAFGNRTARVHHPGRHDPLDIDSIFQQSTFGSRRQDRWKRSGGSMRFLRGSRLNWTLPNESWQAQRAADHFWWALQSAEPPPRSRGEPVRMITHTLNWIVALNFIIQDAHVTAAEKNEVMEPRV